MTTRITGTNSGLDVDSLVTAAMKPYRTKVDTETQNKKILEYQQEQYKQIMSDASSFYDKYFDVLKTGNLISTSSYQTETFTPSDASKVTAKGLAGASLDNYSVSVTQLAAKATESLDVGVIGNKTIKIGTAEIQFDVVANGYTTVSNYNAAVAAKKKTLSDAVTAGTATTEQKTQLADLNANTITAKYSEFNKNVVFTASQMGQGGFTLDGKVATDKYLEATIKNSSGKVYTISASDKKTSNSMTIDNVQFDFKAISTQTSTTTITRLGPADDLTKATPLVEGAPLIGLVDLGEEPSLAQLTELPDDETTITATDGTKTTTKVDGTATTTTTTAADGTITTKKVDGDVTTTTTKTTNGIITTKKEEKDGPTTTTTLASGTTVTSKVETNGTTTTTTVANGITTNNKVEANGTTTTTTKEGTKTTTKITVPYDGSTPISKEIIKDTSTNTTITRTNLISGDSTTTKEEINDGTNTTTTTTAKQKLGDGSTATTTTKEVKLNADNSIISSTATTTNLKVNADGSTTKTVQVDSNDLTATTYNSATLTGETNVTDLKTKIVGFVDDYNKLIQEINTKIFETRDKDYMPLTDDQKKNMSETQITAWEKKAQTGLLRKDSDLQRIVSEMKSAMSSVVSGSGLSLEAIGISPVKNYTDKNGMLTIDEDKLIKALEENGDGVKDLFTRAATTTEKGGVATQLKSALYSEFKTSTAPLSKKAGLLGSSTEYDNTLANNIYKKKLLIADLNASLVSKEDALYKKYSELETAMQSLNAQQSSLASMLGTA